jgi:hypothetical protein
VAAIVPAGKSVYTARSTLMSEALVFRRVRAIDPGAALDAVVDVVIEGGRITRLGPDAARDLLGVSPDRVRVV